MIDAVADREAEARAPDPKPVDAALPYRLEFVDATRVAAPALQSFVLAPAAGGQWFVLGGRQTQGLHTFKQKGANFPGEASNHAFWLIDPATGVTTAFDVSALPSDLAAVLQATNQQAFHDRESDLLYLAGGYGWTADGATMKTFGALLRLRVGAIVAEMQRPEPDPAKIAAAIDVCLDDRFAVTGGALLPLGDQFYLLFGQSFDGQYRAFGGADFTQRYTEAARVFTLDHRRFGILAYGELTTADLDRPFHRRDGNFIASVDPVTGGDRLAAFGGVFQTGKIAGFTNPIHVDGGRSVRVVRSFQQRFNQYSCPVVTLYDPPSSAVYHTFFGGISHGYFHQTEAQRKVREEVTRQGRNDGLPFVADVTTLANRGGVYAEYVMPDPTPSYRLVGASAAFIPDPDRIAEGRFDGDIVRLDRFAAGTRSRIGHVYGGIEADFPYPLLPNHGTAATNAIFEVYLNRVPSAAIPAEACGP